MIESVREALQLRGVLFHTDPLCTEQMVGGDCGIVSVDPQFSMGRDLVGSFTTQSDIGKLTSDCDLVRLRHRSYHTKSVNNALNSKNYSLSNMLDNMANKGLTIHNRNVL